RRREFRAAVADLGRMCRVCRRRWIAPARSPAARHPGSHTAAGGITEDIRPCGTRLELDLYTRRSAFRGITAQEQVVSEPLPAVYLARHGETAWSLSGRHTGRTDLPLADPGEPQARALGWRLRGARFAIAFASSAQRGGRTAELGG